LSSIYQKWRIVEDQLVSMKTIDGEPTVLAHDSETKELSVRKMECGKFDLKWEMPTVQPTSDIGNHMPDDLTNGPFGIVNDDGFFLTVKDGKVIKADLDCAKDQLWLWETDNDSQYGQIVSKFDLNSALQLSKDSLQVDLIMKGNLDSQKWRLSGRRIVPQALPYHALGFDKAGNLVVEYLNCNGENQNFDIVELSCDEEGASEGPDTPDETDETSGPCIKYSVEACDEAIKKLGIARGGKGYPFLGSWVTKGCYAYKSGTYVNHAYYGTGGTTKQMQVTVSGKKFRPKGYDCENDD